jgi:hypothetical protein
VTDGFGVGVIILYSATGGQENANGKKKDRRFPISLVVHDVWSFIFWVVVIL